MERSLPPRIPALKFNRDSQEPLELLDLWRRHLEEQDRSAGTIKKYTQAVARFLWWYEQEESEPLTLSVLTPITLIGYRNYLQHDQHNSVSTINVQVSAHTLRHTFARSYLAQYPGDVVGLASLLGHSSLDTTRLYSQPSVEQ